MNAKQGLKFLFTAIAILCLAVLCVPQTARAQNGTWSANSTNTFNWADAANWTSSTIAGNNTTTDNTGIATFVNRTGTQTVNVDSGRNVFGIDFSGNSNAYTLSGNGILLSNGGFIQTSGGGSGHTDTISSAIGIQGVGGNASFTAGSSTATRLLAVTGNVTGVSTSGNTTALTLNGANTGANAVGGIIGDGSSGGKVSVVKSGAGVWNLNGLNTFTGGLEITQGTLSTGGSGNFGANGTTITLGSSDVNSANTVLLRQGNASDGNTYNITVRSTANATATRTINSAVGALRTLNANVQIGDATGAINSLTLGSFIDLRGAISQSGINQGNLIIVTSTDADARIGGGTSNTHTGNTTVQGGNLILSKTGVSTVAVAGNLIIGTSTTVGNTTVRIDGATGNGGAQLASTSIVSFGGPGTNTFVFNNSFDSVLNLAGLNSAPGINAIVGANDAGTNTHTLNLAGSGNYSFSGIIRNSSSGLGSNRTVTVTKSGNGTQAFLGLNGYTGNTTINSGVLSVSNLANGGSASGIGSSSNASTSLVLNGGTLRYTGNTTSTDRNYTIGTSGATFDASGGGALTLSGTTPTLSGTNAARTLTLTGSNTGNNTFAANLANNGNGATSLVKNGVGTWALSGASTYNGATTVNAGTLIVSGSIASAATVNGTFSLGSGGTAAAVTVNSGGLLTGSGTVGATTIGSGGSINPGNSPGTLTFTGNLTLSSGSTSNFEIDGFTANLFDLAQQSGSQTVNFGGTLNLLFQTGFDTNGSVTIFNFGTYNGSFSEVNTIGLASGYTASFDAANGLVTVVPEPATWLLLTASLCAFLFLRRRTPQA